MCFVIYWRGKHQERVLYDSLFLKDHMYMMCLSLSVIEHIESFLAGGRLEETK